MMTPAGRRILDELRQEVRVEYLPWGGRSPRVLTRAYKRFTLSQRDDDSMEFDAWDEEVLKSNDHPGRGVS